MTSEAPENGDETATTTEISPTLLRDVQADLEESLLGGPRRYTRTEIADFAGVSLERADRLWVSMGFAVDTDPDGVMFTEGDAAALRTIASLVDQGIISPEREVAAARALGQSMSRLAEWQVSLISTHIVDQLAGSAGSDEQAIREQVRELTAEILPAVESLQAYVWRRHIASTTGRNVGNPGEEVASRKLVVGFADIVGYTSLTRQLGARELSDLLERFESASTSVIGRHQGWVVKTVGDEVMFAVESPSDAAEIALQLQEQVLPDEADPRTAGRTRDGSGARPVRRPLRLRRQHRGATHRFGASRHGADRRGARPRTRRRSRLLPQGATSTTCSRDSTTRTVRAAPRPGRLATVSFRREGFRAGWSIRCCRRRRRPKHRGAS